MTPRQHDARVARALVVLALALPAATALSFAQDAPTASAPSATPTRMVGEQVGTAREIVPFGVGRDGDTVVTWAVGQTRAPSPVPRSTPTTPTVARPEEEPVPVPATVDPLETTPETTPGSTTPTTPPTTPAQTTPIDTPDDEPAGQTPADVNVLLVGTASDVHGPSAWKRTAPPLNAAGDALAAGSWRPAGPAAPAGTTPGATSRAAYASPHAGDSTPAGAAALLVRLDGATASSGLLARRADGRFQLLPSPPTELLGPTSTLSNPDAVADIAPLAVIDAKTPDADSTTPAAPTLYGRTGVLLVPPGGDGVLSWDGASWTEEKFLDTAGAPVTPARTPEAIAATPDGDAVALVAGDESGADRVTLYRRLADRSGWRQMELDAPLLSGPRPSGVLGVKPTARPGDPLTVAKGHWWVDVVVQRSDGQDVSASIHLAPGSARATATTPAPTAPTPTTTDPADPTSTTPPATTPAETTPPTTATTPLSPLQARATGVWCSPDPGQISAPATDQLDDRLCTGELPGSFPTGTARGYRSQAFATQGELPTGAAPTTPSAASPFGGRIITSPVVEPTAGADIEGDDEATEERRRAARNASASGGYLRLDGTRFTLRGGLGETEAATGHTEAAAFLSDRLGWTGGARLVGHVTAAAAYNAGAYRGTTPAALYDPPVDIMTAPPSVPDGDSGAVSLLSGYLRRDFVDGRAPTIGGFDLFRVVEGPGRSMQAGTWYARDAIAIVGTNGLLVQVTPPSGNSDLPFYTEDQAGRVELKLVNEAAGMNLMDVAYSSATVSSDEGPVDGWAVGRSGALLHLTAGDRPNPAKPAAIKADIVKLAAPLTRADLRQIAYAGDTPYIASSRGPLVGKDGTFVIDTDLAAMIEADGRSPEVRTVAALPDGAVVFDGRYARNSATEAWQRLPSPAEGDVVALAVARPGGDPAGGLATLQIQASIADQAKPRVGEIVRNGYIEGPNEEAVEQVVELTSAAPDGRLTQLTADGWIDRTRTPIGIGRRVDLTAPNAPVQSISVEPGGTGWAAGGSGSYRGQFDTPVTAPRGTMVQIDDRAVLRPPAAADTPTAPVASAPEATAPLATTAARSAAPARRRQLPAPTTTDPAPTSGVDPVPTTGGDQSPPTGADDPGIPKVTPDSKPIKLLIGGHPSCLDTCTGAEDQALAPLEGVRQALATSRGMRSEGIGAVIIGGGRESAGGPGLSRAGAQSYADLLRSEPGTPPVFAAIGTGDTKARGELSADSRTAFTKYVASELQPLPANQAGPGAPRAVEFPGVPTPLNVASGEVAAAYAFDVPGETGGAARVIVIDNTDGRLRNGRLQTQWLLAMLDDARSRGRAAVVVGSAPIDRDLGDDGQDEAALIDILTRGQAAAYVSTDGEDNPKSERFGLHERSATVGPAEIPVFHTSALGHAIPIPVRNAIPYSRIRNEDNTLVKDGPVADAVDSGAALLQLTVPADVVTPKSSGPAAPEALDDVDGQSVPVFRDFAAPEQSAVIIGDATQLYIPTLIDADNGTRWNDPNNPASDGQPASGVGVGNATPYPCRLWFTKSDCEETLPRSGRFTTDDPSVAVFVRARLAKTDDKVKGKDKGKQSDEFIGPEIVVDGNGEPIRDNASPVFCPLKAGTTGVTLTVSGRTMRWNVRVIPPPEGYKPAGTAKKCEFFWRALGNEPPAKKPTAVVPPVPGILKPVAPVPEPSAKPKPSPTEQPQVPLARPLPPALPLLGIPTLAQPSAAPPVAPNPKPFAHPTPIPPSGVSLQQAPSIQSMTVMAQQKETEKEVAMEGADHQATIYRAAPRSDVTLALAGGALALLIAAAGHAAGRRRALTRAAARRFLR